MQPVTFIKLSPFIQAGHLYEHLFCRKLTQTLHSLGYFEFLDYTLEANTYYGGFIHVYMLVRKDIAEEIIDSVTSCKIDTSEEALDICIAQIIAEKQHSVGIHFKTLRAELKKLEAANWQPLNDIKSIDSTKLHTDNRGIYIEDEMAPTRTLRATIQVSHDFITMHRSLLPLCYVLLMPIAYAVRQELVNSYGYYSTKQESGTDDQGFRIIDTYRADGQFAPKITTEIKTLKQYFAETVRNHLIPRTLTLMHTPSYVTDRHQIDEREIYKSTGILIGAQGWKDITNEQSAQRILEHSHILIRSGKSKHLIKLDAK